MKLQIIHLIHPSAFASSSFYQLATHNVRGWLVLRLLYIFHVCLFVGWFVSVCLLVGLCLFVCWLVCVCLFVCWFVSVCLLVGLCPFVCLLVVSVCLLVGLCLFVCWLVCICLFVGWFVTLCVCTYHVHNSYVMHTINAMRLYLVNFGQLLSVCSYYE